MNPPVTRGIRHIALRVKNLKAMRHFYVWHSEVHR